MAFKFTNNKGSANWPNGLYSLKHVYKNGPEGKKSSLEITVSMVISGSQYEFDVLSSAQRDGGLGTLELPHRVYEGAAVTGVSTEDGIWRPFGKATVSFLVDAEMGFGIATLKDAGGSGEITLYSSQLSLSFGGRTATSYKLLHNMGYFQLGGVASSRIMLTGVAVAKTWPDVVNILDVLEQRDGIYAPHVKDLGDFVPEAATALPLKKVVITDGSVDWRVEDLCADVRVSFLAPPQKI
jgi:hypothetical protein